jgi:hypothetical protein
VAGEDVGASPHRSTFDMDKKLVMNAQNPRLQFLLSAEKKRTARYGVCLPVDVGK